MLLSCVFSISKYTSNKDSDRHTKTQANWSMQKAVALPFARVIIRLPGYMLRPISTMLHAAPHHHFSLKLSPTRRICSVRHGSELSWFPGRVRRCKSVVHTKTWWCTRLRRVIRCVSMLSPWCVSKEILLSLTPIKISLLWNAKLKDYSCKDSRNVVNQAVHEELLMLLI